VPLCDLRSLRNLWFQLFRRVIHSPIVLGGGINDPMSKPIESYALIGNCRTAALVGLDGSIDWLCLPHFGSGACFAALLGTDENGRWLLAPTASHTSKRQYRGDTMILETEFTTVDGGVATVVDFMPRPDDGDGTTVTLVRTIRPVRGSVAFRSDVTFRFDYGHEKPWVQKYDGGIRAVAGPDAVVFRSTVPLHGEDFRTVGDVTVSAGLLGSGDVSFVLSYFPSHLACPDEPDPKRMERDTEKLWTKWAGRYTHEHPWRDAVMRSLLTLKAMTYEPTGGIVAAPTTSLPEDLGGVRNWDYRYCWIRDATLTLFAFMSTGFLDEADAWREWLLRAAAGSPEKLQIMYGIHGERRLTELELEWLPGYGDSKPVRLGNGAHDQFQLDVYGELMGALHLARVDGAKDENFDAWHVQCSLMRFIEQNWNQPDNGIWEVRGGRRQFTHSKVMAWMAVDRSVRDIEKFGLEGPLEQWRALRETIHADVCANGFNKAKNAFTQYYGADELDAALLIIPQTGFLPASDPRFVGTVEAIERELLTQAGFVQRYQNKSGVDGLPGGEAAFLPCTFWLAGAYALIGRKEDALKLFEKLLALRNDVGLLSEEYDCDRERLMGNFPQAFTHVSLIGLAGLLAEQEGAMDPMKHNGHTGGDKAAVAAQAAKKSIVRSEA
jgi:GH15 family glucan-1,4-alpha-glucosidase